MVVGGVSGGVIMVVGVVHGELGGALQSCCTIFRFRI